MSSAARRTKTQLLGCFLVLLGWICIGASLGGFVAKNILLPVIFKHATEKTHFLVMHAGIATGGIIAGPLLYWYQIEKKTLHDFFAKSNQADQLVGLTVVLTLLAMVINNFINYWNMQIHFPSSLAFFEKWAKEQQITLEKHFTLLTTFDSAYDLLATICVVGILTAVGEELVCRGILQDVLYQATARESVSIGIASFIFSAIHLDPYSFFPRFFMGLLLGYLYSWTRNLFFPILSHFLNNTLVLILAFLEKKDLLQLVSENNSVSWLTVIGCCIGGMITIFYLKKQVNH